MRIFMTLSAMALAMAIPTGLAAASDDDDHVGVPCDNWLTIAQITQKVASAGYDIRKVEIEGDGYEMYAINKEGKRVELEIDPLTGEVLEEEREDDWDDD